MRKSNVAWLFAVIVLSFLLVLSFILGLSGYYFSMTYMNSDADIVVGDTVSIGVRANEASVMSFTFDGGYLPNELMPQIIQINGQDLNQNIRIRIKSTVFGSEELSELKFITTDHFEQADDGYYYYDDILRGGNKITFCNFVEFPRNAEFSSNEKYILTVVVETLEENIDYQNVWKNVQQ